MSGRQSPPSGGTGTPGGPAFPPGGYPPPGTPQSDPVYRGQSRGRRPAPLVELGVIEQRSAAVVLLLSIVTCNIYYLYWLYATSSELKRALADDDIKPGVDLLLSVLTCSVWGIYVEYRNAQKVHAALLFHDPHTKDQSDTVLMLNLASLFVGVTWLVATYIVQEELNKLARY